MKLDREKFQPIQAAPAMPAGSNASTPPAASEAQTIGTQLAISSTPAGADIEIDGNFVGSTPSTISVAAGAHQVVLKKKGFKPWERKVTTSNGQVNISAELETQ
jgi:diacylglycerol kinase family enzyme